jgi:hypothetical protein
MTRTVSRSAFRMPLRLGLAAGLASSLVAGVAHAGMPGVLDRVPVDAPMFVAIPDLQSMLTDVTAFSNEIGDALPAEAREAIAQIGVLQLLVSQPGMNANGSAAIVFIPNPAAGPNEDPMTAAAVLPITDFGAFAESPFVQGQGAQMNGGVMTLDFFGQSVFIRDLGGFAVVGDDRDLVSEFDGQKGRMGAHKTALGVTGDRVANSSDAMLVANVEMLAPGMREGLGMMEQQVAFLAAMGGGPAVGEGFGVVKMVAENFMRDASSGMIGINFSAEGVALDIASQFSEGSELSQMFAAGDADSDELLTRMPRMDFLIAGAADTSSPGIQKIAAALNEFSSSMQEAAAEQLGGEAPTLGFDKLSNATGFTGAIGAAPAMGGGGLFANSLAYYRVPDAAQARKDIKAGMAEANGVTAAGVTYTTMYEEGAQTIAGLEADAYSLQTQMDPNAMGGAGGMGMMADPAMIQQMMFGFTGGPNGFIAQDNDGLFMTASKNSQLLERAVNASKGDADDLSENPTFTETRKHLMDAPTAQFYIAADQIANTVGPFAVMLGAVDQFEQAESMPPVGVGIAARDGGFTARLFIPSPVIEFTAQFVPEDEGMEWEDGDDAEAPPF